MTAAAEFWGSAGDGRGPGSAGAGSPQASSPEAGSPAHDGSAVDAREQVDPWFGVAHRLAAEEGSPTAGEETGSDDQPAAGSAPTAAGSAPVTAQADWFLPGGRAGLLPDSMIVSSAETVSPADAGSGESRRETAPVAAAGAPPWADETPGSAAGEPPPWENGPWPGTGAARPASPAGQPHKAAAHREQAARSWTPRTVLVTGLLPLVVPGLVAGVLGLRGSRAGEPVRRASLLAIAASLAWAVVFIVLITTTAGGSPGGCSYPAAVHNAYLRAMADMRTKAPVATQAADLGLAAGEANSAAAAVGQLRVRTDLSVLAGDLQQARADVIANRAIPADLRTHLAADGTALTASCAAAQS